MSDTDDSVLKAQNEGLDDVLTDARELYEQVKLADLRSDQAIQEFVAGVAMVIREARREPDQFDAECKTAEIKRGNKRLEVCATRLAANDPHLAKPRWASAAAYIADRPAEAPTRSEATELIRRTPNGITGLAELHAARTTPEPEPVALTEWADAQLDGIGPDAIVDDLAALEGDGHSYRLILEKQMPDGSSRVWLLSESDGFGEPTIRRAVKKVKSRVILQHDPSRYADPSVGPRLDRAERKVRVLIAEEAVLADDRTGPATTDKPEHPEEEADAAGLDGAGSPAETPSIHIEAVARPNAGSVGLRQPMPVRAQPERKPRAEMRMGTNRRVVGKRCTLSCGCQYAKLCREQGRCVGASTASATTPATVLLPPPS